LTLSVGAEPAIYRKPVPDTETAPTLQLLHANIGKQLRMLSAAEVLRLYAAIE